MTLAAVACGIASVGLVLLVLAGPSYRIGLLSLASAATVLRRAMWVGAASTAAGALAAWLAYRRRARLAMLAAAVATASGDTTTWFGFTDDIVVRFTSWGAGTRVDIRSMSRGREHDMGTNARRIRRFLAALQ